MGRDQISVCFLLVSSLPSFIKLVPNVLDQTLKMQFVSNARSFGCSATGKHSPSTPSLTVSNTKHMCISLHCALRRFCFRPAHITGFEEAKVADTDKYMVLIGRMKCVQKFRLSHLGIVLTWLGLLLIHRCMHGRVSPITWYTPDMLFIASGSIGLTSPCSSVKNLCLSMFGSLATGQNRGTNGWTGLAPSCWRSTFLPSLPKTPSWQQ